MEVFSGNRCGIDGCRSREYHIDSGFTFCRRGHLQEGRVQHEQDFEDVNIAASQTTKIKDSQKEEQTRRELQELGGPRGLKLFRHAYEHVLRCQLQVLVQKGYPPEIEGIARELWALRVQIAADDGVDLNKDGNTGLADAPGGPSREGDESEDELREQERGKAPAFVEMFAICYMTLVILRMPISVAKMHDWISKEELHFLGVLNVIPVEMKRKFEPWVFHAFEVQSSMQRPTLRKHISELCIRFSNRYQTFKLPALNWKPLLLDYIAQLALPMHVFSFIHDAASMMSLDFSFPPARNQGKKNYLAKLPDVQLMAWVVFAVKSYYPFGGKELFATNAKDPGYLAVDWHAWKKTHDEFEHDLEEQGPSIKPGTEADVTLEQVMDFDDEEADAYMDWFASTWLEDNATESSDRHVKVPEGLPKMFPIDGDGSKQRQADRLAESKRLEADLTSDMLRRVHASLRPRRIISEEKEAQSGRRVPRPGLEFYEYRSIEDLESHECALEFHRKAADIASIGLEALIKVVRQVDKKMKDWEASEAGGTKEAAGDNKRL